MGGVLLVNWCICGPTHRAIKTGVVPDRIKIFSSFSQKKILVLLSASVERFGVSRMRDFLYYMLNMFLSKACQGENVNEILC